MRLFFDELTGDLRYVRRRMVAQWPSTCAITLILSLSIGANAALFAMVRSAVLAPLPGVAHHGLTGIYRNTLDRPSAKLPVSYSDFRALESQNELFAGTLAFVPFREALSVSDGTRVAVGEFVSDNYFEVLSVPTILGSSLLPRAREGEPIAVISERLWRSAYAAAPDAIGKTVRLNGLPVSIVGVVGTEFGGLHAPTLVPADLFVPMRFMSQLTSSVPDNQARPENIRSVYVKARLRDDVSRTQAQSALEVLAIRLASSDATLKDARFVVVDSASEGPFPLMSEVAVPVSSAVLVLVSLVLIIACANVASMLLAGVVARLHEFSVRMSVGASPYRLLRLIGLEAFALSLAGGLGAIIVAIGCVRLLMTGLPRIDGLQPTPHIIIDATTWGYLFLIVSAATLLTALGPGWYVNRRLENGDLNAVAKSAVRVSAPPERRRLTTALIVSQLTVAMALVALGATFVKSAVVAQRWDTGIEPNDIVTVSIDLKYQPGLPEPNEAGYKIFESILDASRRSTRVRAVALVDKLPIGTARNAARVSVDHQPDQVRQISFARVSADYFDVIGTYIKQGRPFDDRDTSGSARVTIVSELTARRLWGTTDPVGRRLLMSDGVSLAVVGVAEDTDVRNVGERGRLFMYVPFTQNFSTEAMFLLKIAADPELAVRDVMSHVSTIEPKVPVLEVSTADSYLDAMRYPVRVRAWITGAFAALAFILGALGLAGMTHTLLRERRGELAIRAILGLGPVGMVRLVLKDALVITFVGMIVGVVVATLLNSLISSAIFGAPQLDLTVVLTTALMFGVASLAVPAAHAVNLVRQPPISAVRDL